MKVLITDRFADAARVYLSQQAGFIVENSKSHHLKDWKLEGYEALLIRSRTIIDERLLSNAPDLKVVISATSGFDHIDLKACEAKGVRVAHTPEANAVSASELTWALVLACSRSLVQGHLSSKAGEWNTLLLPGHELAGKTYGVIGLGRIGQRVAKIASAFGMRVLAHDPYLDDEGFVQSGALRRSLDEVLRESDVLSLHVPLTKLTRRMINRNTLEGLHEDSILVNTSRGEVIDEEALLDALKRGEVGAVGLDVFESEPLKKDSPLLRHKNVTVSPHVGARTNEAFEKASIQAAEALVAFSSGRDLPHSLPPTAVWYTNPMSFD